MLLSLLNTTCIGTRLRKYFFFCPLFFLLIRLAAGSASTCSAGEPLAFLLKTNAVVDSEGIFLSQVIEAKPEISFPQVRLADAPAFGQAIILTRAQIADAAQKLAPDSISTNLSGAGRVRITRRARSLEELEIKELLTETLQRDSVREKGELELRFTRPWITITIPDEPFVLNVLELPATGIGPSLILRFELRHGRELFGSWQLSAQARIWKEVWVSRFSLKRGQILGEADVRRERKDMFVLRDTLSALSWKDGLLELTENIQEGAPLFTRSVKARPSIRRGDLVEAFLQEGALSVSLRVEVLEDGLPGQLVRVRNPQSKREFRGKVQNEKTILIAL